MSHRIEPVFPAAAGPLALLHRACFPDDFWDQVAIKHIMGIPGFFGQIGWTKDAPVGFVLALDLGKEAEIISLGVARHHRRRGIGSALLGAACLEARQRRAECVLLEVAADNDAARALYAEHGFIAVGVRRNYYRRRGLQVDAVTLRAPLAAAPLAI